MPDYVFPGMAPFIDEAAKSAGYDVVDANDPRHLLIGQVKSSPLLSRLGTQLGQIDGSTAENKPGIYDAAEDIVWILGVANETAKAAMKAVSDGHAIDDIKAKATKAAAKLKADKADKTPPATPVVNPGPTPAPADMPTHTQATTAPPSTPSTPTPAPAK